MKTRLRWNLLFRPPETGITEELKDPMHDDPVQS